MNTFLAATLPKSAVAIITESLKPYKEKLSFIVPQDKWHITLVFLGNASLSSETLLALSEPLHVTYVPTITTLSLGTGTAQGQLWAHVYATPALLELRNLLLERLKECNVPLPYDELSREYVPHMKLGNIDASTTSLWIPDTPAKTTFSLQELHVLQSVSSSYEHLATIPLVP